MYSFTEIVTTDEKFARVDLYVMRAPEHPPPPTPILVFWG